MRKSLGRYALQIELPDEEWIDDSAVFFQEGHKVELDLTATLYFGLIGILAEAEMVLKTIGIGL